MFFCIWNLSVILQPRVWFCWRIVLPGLGNSSGLWIHKKFIVLLKVAHFWDSGVNRSYLEIISTLSFFTNLFCLSRCRMICLNALSEHFWGFHSKIPKRKISRPKILKVPKYPRAKYPKSQKTQRQNTWSPKYPRPKYPRFKQPYKLNN